MKIKARRVLVASLFFLSLHSFASDSDEVQCCDEKKRPNVLIILADDLGYGDIGANGSIIATPNIDALANSGARFKSFYASANVCTPSRAGLLTGRYPIRTGLAYGVIASNHTHGLKQEEVTLAEALQAEGYRTALIGKWHLGHLAEHWPTEHGFEYYFGLPYSNDQTPLSLYRNAKVVTNKVDQAKLTKQYTEETIHFIEESKETPFLVYLSHTFPHLPLHVPEEFSGRSKAGLYGDVVEHLDWSTGEIVKALKRTGKFEDTLIVITSDNGPWFEGSSGEYRGGKGSTWEGAYRVPFIISWPAAIQATAAKNAMAMNIDVFPTILDATGIKLPEHLEVDGKSLLPLVLGETDVSPHDYLLFFNNEEVVGVRTQQWKLLTRTYYRRDYAALDKFDGDGYWLLWDLQASHPERYSMARDHPDQLRELKAVLAAAVKEFEPLRTRAPMKVRF